MKYIKHFEDNENKSKYIYLIADFFKSPEERFFILRIKNIIEDYIKYDIYYYYDKDDFNAEIIKREYPGSYYKYDDKMKIIYQANSIKEAIEKIRIAIEINKYNL